MYVELSTVHFYALSVFIISALLGDKQRFGSGGLITLNYAHPFDVQNPKSCTYLRSFVKVLNTFYISCPHFADQCAKAHISPSTTQVPRKDAPAQRPFKAYACREKASGGCLSRQFASRGMFLTLLQEGRYFAPEDNGRLARYASRGKRPREGFASRGRRFPRI